MTVEEYRKDPALNFSLAKILATETPAHFLEARENPDREETIAMRMGTAVHDLLQGKFQEYAIKPAFNPITRNQADTWHGNKTWCKEWMSEQILPMLSADEYAAVVGMRDALSENPVFQMLQQMCPVVETPVFATYRGVKIKALPDMIGYDSEGNRFIVDLKTALDVSAFKFAKTVKNMCYHIQQAWYCNAVALAEGLEEKPRYMLFTVEKSRPHLTRSFFLPDKASEQGQRQMDKIIDLYLECMEKDLWPGYPDQPTILPWWDDEKSIPY